MAADLATLAGPYAARLRRADALAEPGCPGEARLQALWQSDRRPKDLALPDGTPVEVLDPGRWNHAPGPDFRDALLSFGGALRRGDVELHLRPADWDAHGHAADPAYAGVLGSCDDIVAVVVKLVSVEVCVCVDEIHCVVLLFCGLCGLLFHFFLLVLTVVVYHAEAAAVVEALLHGLVLEAGLYLVPQVEQHGVDLGAYLLQGVERRGCALLQSLLLCVAFLEDVEVCAYHAYRGVVYGASAGLDACLLALGGLPPQPYQACGSLEWGQGCGVLVEPVEG